MNRNNSVKHVDSNAALIEDEEAVATARATCRYALIDPAQDDQLLDRLRGLRSRCFLGDSSAVRSVSPHLVELPSEIDSTRAWEIIQKHGVKKPCVVLIGSNLKFDELFAHFLLFLDVQVNSSTSMLLAWWDPSFIACLLGQPTDETLYVKGPIFDAAQRRAFLGLLHNISYWDRRGCMRSVDIAKLDELVPAQESKDNDPILPLKFSAEQVRLMVKAATPDQVIYELRLNQPGVLSDRSEWENYRMTCDLVNAADTYGIKGLQDLVNFAGAGMILGERFYQFPPIAQALAVIREGRGEFTEVLKSLPPEVVEQARTW